MDWLDLRPGPKQAWAELGFTVTPASLGLEFQVATFKVSLSLKASFFLG